MKQTKEQLDSERLEYLIMNAGGIVFAPGKKKYAVTYDGETDKHSKWCKSARAAIDHEMQLAHEESLEAGLQ